MQVKEINKYTDDQMKGVTALMMMHSEVSSVQLAIIKTCLS